VVDSAVALLLNLKSKYKAATGADWKPGSQQPPTAKQVPAQKEASPVQATKEKSSVADQLSSDIVVQGDKVRNLSLIQIEFSSKFPP